VEFVLQLRVAIRNSLCVCDREREEGEREKEDHCGPGLISEELRFRAFQRYQKSCATKARSRRRRSKEGVKIIIIC
jgi:hypothetical protein